MTSSSSLYLSVGHFVPLIVLTYRSVRENRQTPFLSFTSLEIMVGHNPVTAIVHYLFCLVTVSL